VIASRYRLDEPSPKDPDAFVGTDQQSGAEVTVVPLTRSSAEAIRAACDVEHQHLCKIVEIVALDDESSALVTVRVLGITLDEKLAAIGKKQPVDAVRSALRVADAVSALHAAGAIHGAVVPAAVVIEPSDDHAAPTLCWVTARPSPFRSPARGETGEPSVADDAWAVAALLHLMLTGKPPPPDGIALDVELAEAGVQDAVLRAALAHGLARDPLLRSPDMKALKRDLARWFVDHAGEETPGAHTASAPPPLPSSAGPPSVAAVPAVSTSKLPAATVRPVSRRPVVLLAGAAIVLGLGAAWAVSTMRRPKVEIVERAASAPGPAKPAPKAIDLGEQPVTAASAALKVDKMASCVSGFVPKGTFGTPPELGWVCTENDPRGGANRLRSAIVAGKPTYGGPTETMKLFSVMGSYDMAAFAIVRAGCCVDAEALTLPEGSPECGDLAALLREIGKTVAIDGQKPEKALADYTQALDCEVKARHAALFSIKTRPRKYEQQSFEHYVELIKPQ
jgi:hypothetical protein